MHYGLKSICQTPCKYRSMWLVGLIERKNIPALASHRTKAGWTYLASDNALIYLRVPSTDDHHFSKLPLKQRWLYQEESGTLTKIGNQLPENSLQGDWQPIVELINIGKVAKTQPGEAPLPIGFRLVEVAQTAPIDLLICQWSTFTQWSTTVLEQRTESLEVAIDQDGDCLVKGEPLPGINGKGFYQVGRLYLQAGYQLPDFIWPELVETALNLSDQEAVIISAAGEWSRLLQDGWVKANRATIRINQR